MTEYSSIVISVVAVAVAIYFGIKTHHLGKENADLQRRLVKIEEAKEYERKKATSKAKLQAAIVDYGQRNHRLVIENTGDCEARNINLIMDGKPFEEHQAAVSGEGKINHIGPHSSATKLLALTTGCAPPFELEIYWDDDSGEKGRYQTTLTF
jgi:hypothetical protein